MDFCSKYDPNDDSVCTDCIEGYEFGGIGQARKCY